MTNTNRAPVDIGTMHSWGQAVLNRAGEDEPPDVEPGWWQHAAIKCAEKGLRLADEVETQGREIARYREALTKIATNEGFEIGFAKRLMDTASEALQSPTQAPLQVEPT